MSRPVFMAFLAIVLSPAVGASHLKAATTTLTAAKDNSLFADHVTNSGGGGPGIFSGTNGNNSPRRALIAFDILSSGSNPNGIPTGSIITGVELSLHLGNAPNNDAHDIGLHRLTKDWGEGTTGSTSQVIMMTGQGFPAGEGDATWDNAKTSSNPPDVVPWTSAGAIGDFVAVASATTAVTGPVDSPTAFVWESTSSLVSDVQSWLDTPTSNFGWIMINKDENVSRSIKVFYSREATLNALSEPLDPTWRPGLTITYTPPTLPTGDYNHNGIVDGADYIVWRNSFGQTASPSGSGADGNQNGTIDPGDFDYWRARFGNVVSATASNAAIPEPGSALLLITAVTLVYLSLRR